MMQQEEAGVLAAGHKLIAGWLLDLLMLTTREDVLDWLAGVR